jgi:hypothetical protein
VATECGDRGALLGGMWQHVFSLVELRCACCCSCHTVCLQLVVFLHLLFLCVQLLCAASMLLAAGMRKGAGRAGLCLHPSCLHPATRMQPCAFLALSGPAACCPPLQVLFGLRVAGGCHKG